MSAAPAERLFDPDRRQQELSIFGTRGKSFAAPPIPSPVSLNGIVWTNKGGHCQRGYFRAFYCRWIVVQASRSHAISPPKPTNVGNSRFRELILANRCGCAWRPGRLQDRDDREPGNETARRDRANEPLPHFSGRVADVEGKPYADAVLRYGIAIGDHAGQSRAKEAEPQEPLRTDAKGDFKTPPLLPDGYYRLTIRAAAKTTESDWLDATKAEASTAQAIVIARLRGVSGVVRDRAGKPIADAQVSFFTKETRTETATNGAGKFQLEIPVGKPFCVIVRHADFRAAGFCYDKSPPNLNQTMIRVTEPDEKLALRPSLSKEERGDIEAAARAAQG